MGPQRHGPPAVVLVCGENRVTKKIGQHMRNKPERKKQNLQWDRDVNGYGCSLLGDVTRMTVQQGAIGHRCQQSAGLISLRLFSVCVCVCFHATAKIEILCCKTEQAVDVPLPFDSIPQFLRRQSSYDNWASKARSTRITDSSTRLYHQSTSYPHKSRTGKLMTDHRKQKMTHQGPNSQKDN